MTELKLNVECFNLKYTLECGQCFRWQKVDNSYIGVINDRVIKTRLEDGNLYVKSNNMDNIENILCDYFDLNVDYKKTEQHISTIDEYVKKAVNNTTGIRILNQSFFEILISYIISANNNIPRISKSVLEISKKYGSKVTFEEKPYYLFPTVEQLSDVSQIQFRECGVGFRDKYIKKTIDDILSKNIKFEEFKNMPTLQIREELLKLQGVGPKVADCILLFSCGRKEVFPIDVWVEKIMRKLYFTDDNITKKEIVKHAYEKFGVNAGIVQQHLFYNIRENML
ncbi:MAG: DNA glycosylase [Clostridia bacterium]